MPRLNSEARETLRAEGFTTRQWAQLHGFASAADWSGDACGCTDDRCIGHHHDANEECGCLSSLIADQHRRERATARGREVWTAHMHAESTGNADDRAAVDRLLAEWILDFCRGAISYEITREGITYRNQYNDTTWLVFDASTMTATL